MYFSTDLCIRKYCSTRRPYTQKDMKGIFDSIADAVSDVADSVTDTLDDAIDSVGDAVGSVPIEEVLQIKPQRALPAGEGHHGLSQVQLPEN